MAKNTDIVDCLLSTVPDCSDVTFHSVTYVYPEKGVTFIQIPNVETQIQQLKSSQDSLSETDALVADWDRPDNTENPRNWSKLKKAGHVIPVALLCLSVAAGSSIITPGIFAIAHKYQVSHTAALLSLSLFVIGLATGPITAPVSETRGRSMVYKVSMPLYMLFTAGAGLSSTFGGLLTCRLLAAIAGAPCLAVGVGTVTDLFETGQMAAPGALVVITPFLGLCLGPVIGGFGATLTEYKSTQWSTIFLALFAYALILPTQETHRKVLLNRKADSLGIAPPEPKLPSKEAVRPLIAITLFRPVHMLVTEPIVLLYSIYNAVTFSVLLAFFEVYPLVFMGEYGFSISHSGLTFLAVGLGALLGVLAAVAVDLLVYQRTIRNGSIRVRTHGPEQRLYIGMIGDLCLPIGLIWFALTANPTFHWLIPVLAGIPFAFGSVTVFISAALYMLDVYGPSGSASAMAAIGLLRYIMGASFPLFTVQMYQAMGVKWATMLFAFVGLLMLPIPWILYKFGPAIRRRSAYT